MKKVTLVLVAALVAASATPALAEESIRPTAATYAAPSIGEATTVLTGKARAGKAVRAQSRLFGGGGGMMAGLGFLPFITAFSTYLGYSSVDKFRSDLRNFLGLGNSPT